MPSARRPPTARIASAQHHDLRQRRYLERYQRGRGPLYSFYTPYYLRHFEIPVTAARAALMGEATVRALAVRQVEAVAITKIDLKAGAILDGVGGYHYYGEAEKAHVSREGRLLPVGAAEGCTVTRDLSKGMPLTYGDVTLPSGRLIDQLLEAQAKLPANEPVVPPGELTTTELLVFRE